VVVHDRHPFSDDRFQLIEVEEGFRLRVKAAGTSVVACAHGRQTSDLSAELRMETFAAEFEKVQSEMRPYIVVCRVSRRATCRSCATCELGAVSRRCHHDQSQARVIFLGRV
jgi:hypothetical protein